MLSRSPQPRFACQSLSMLMVRRQPCVWRLLAPSPVGALRVQQQGPSAGESPGPAATGGICCPGEPIPAWERTGNIAEQSLGKGKGRPLAHSPSVGQPPACGTGAGGAATVWGGCPPFIFLAEPPFFPEVVWCTYVNGIVKVTS